VVFRLRSGTPAEIAEHSLRLNCCVSTFGRHHATGVGGGGEGALAPADFTAARTTELSFYAYTLDISPIRDFTPKKHFYTGCSITRCRVQDGWSVYLPGV
jgi:hypothetical protein